MKKITSVILVLLLMFALCACNGEQQAYEACKVVYENTRYAQEIAELLSSDIYQAWGVGIYERDEILEKGTKHLAKTLNLSSDELLEGVGYANGMLWEGEWENLDDDTKRIYKQQDSLYFNLNKDKVFNACVIVVIDSYIVNGKLKDAQNALEVASEQMKILSEKHSDYEHYDKIKEYFAITKSFLDFSQNPSGNYEQAGETINDYEKRERDCINALEFAFNN